MDSSSTSESDSLPVSSACKAQRWYESQSRRLNNEGEKFFSALRADGSALRASMHLPVHIQNCFLWPCTVSAHPFNIPRSAPDACRPTLPLTQLSRRMLIRQFSSWLPPLAKKVMYGPEWLLKTVILYRMSATGTSSSDHNTELR